MLVTKNGACLISHCRVFVAASQSMRFCTARKAAWGALFAFERLCEMHAKPHECSLQHFAALKQQSVSASGIMGFAKLAQAFSGSFWRQVALRTAQHFKSHHEFLHRGRAQQRRIEVRV